MTDPNPYRKYNISIEAPRFKCKELRVTDIISPELDDVEERVTLLEDDVTTLQSQTQNITATPGTTNLGTNFTADSSYVIWDSTTKCLAFGRAPSSAYGLALTRALYVNAAYTGNGNVNIVNYTLNSKNITVSTSLLKTDSTNSRVGVNTATPGHTLDVAGNTNISTGSTYKINGVDVITATGLGGGVLSSGLTSIGTQTAGVDIALGQTYKVNGVDVLSSSTLGGSVLASSLTSIGTQTSGVNIASGQTYKINSTDVLSSTTLGSGVTTSSLDTINPASGLLTIGGSISSNLRYTYAYERGAAQTISGNGVSLLFGNVTNNNHSLLTYDSVTGKFTNVSGGTLMVDVRATWWITGGTGNTTGTQRMLSVRLGSLYWLGAQMASVVSSGSQALSISHIFGVGNNATFDIYTRSDHTGTLISPITTYQHNECIITIIG